MVVRNSWLGALGAGAILLVTGCGGGSPEARGEQPDAETVAPTETAEIQPGEAPDNWQRIGGDDSGFDLSIPPEWKTVDPTKDVPEGVQEGFGLKGAEGELVKSALEILKGEGAEFAVDPATETGEYASNLESACTSGGQTGSDLESLRKKAEGLNTRLGAENLQITDVAVAGKAGLKVTYNSTSKPGGVPVDNTEIQVPVAGGKYCYVNVRAKTGTLRNADEIINTFEPH